MLTVTYVSGHFYYQCARVGPRKLNLIAGEVDTRSVAGEGKSLSYLVNTTFYMQRQALIAEIATP